jgi:hypothetical protein
MELPLWNLRLAQSRWRSGHWWLASDGPVACRRFEYEKRLVAAETCGIWAGMLPAR